MTHRRLFLDNVPADLRDDAGAYVDDLIARRGYDIEPSFLGFLDDYVDIASILRRHVLPDTPLHRGERSFDVYDIGCCYALQHVLFPFARRYVGIDMWPAQGEGGLDEPRFFLPNCTFVRGRFADVADSLGIDPDRSVAVSVMALSCLGRPDDYAAVLGHFRRIIIP